MPERCPTCKGRGTVPKKCPRCGGCGEIFAREVNNLIACPECEGRGREKSEDELNLERILGEIGGSE
jgi:DnaJ-class molecular chaperone